MAAPVRALDPGEEFMDPGTFTSLQPRLVEARAAAGQGWPPRASPTIELTELATSPPTSPGTAEPDRERAEPGTLRPPASPAEAAALEAELDRASSRDHVARLAVHLARAYAPATALFGVHRGMIAGTSSEGLHGRGEGLLVPADSPSCFAEVAAGGEPFRGAPPEGGLDRRIFRAVGRQYVEEIVLLPVAIGQRVVSLLYADSGPEALGDASVAALGTVCERVSRAYERLILERKRAEQADASNRVA